MNACYCRNIYVQWRKISIFSQWVFRTFWKSSVVVIILECRNVIIYKKMFTGQYGIKISFSCKPWDTQARSIDHSCFLLKLPKYVTSRTLFTFTSYTSFNTPDTWYASTKFIYPSIYTSICFYRDLDVEGSLLYQYSR